ncbi:hypothetical protein KQI65_07505 [bacterium]|nr:hypothetical protein [bacterium]
MQMPFRIHNLMMLLFTFVLSTAVQAQEAAFKAAGVHSVQWHAQSDDGVALPSGTYLYTLRTANEVSTRSMMLAK